MTIGQLLLAACVAIKDLGQTEAAEDVLILKRCMAKSLPMALGDRYRYN